MAKRSYLGLRGRALNYAIGIIAGCDFMLFGYDQGVMGGILTLDVFLAQFPIINPDAAGGAESSSRRSTYQGVSVASYNLGCFLGSILTIFIGNPLGRKRTIMLGTAIMVVGAALQASAFSIEHLIVGRIVTGVGNGCNTSTVPTWQSETSRAHRRGQLVMIEGALISGGIMISYWIDLGLSFAPGSAAWRFPLAFQIVFCLLILAFIPHLPESPRWLVLQGREDEARDVLAALAADDDDDDDGDDDGDLDDRAVQAELVEIRDAVREMARGSFRDLFATNRDRNLHRTLLAYANQVFQQISGINLITYYAPVIYTSLGMGSFLSRLLAALNGTEYFLASWPAVFLVERVGRRKLMLFGAAGQAVAMAVLAGASSVSATSRSAAVVAVVFLFVFNTFFAIGWLGMTWLYPAEVMPLRIRAPANALSTSANWIFNFMVVMVTPVAFSSIGYKTYVIFAAINAFIVPCVYLFYPETACRSLEEMDAIFHKARGLRGIFTVVRIAQEEPRRYGKNGELLIEYEQTDEYLQHHDKAIVEGKPQRDCRC